MNLQALIPTVGKSREEVLKLCGSLNINSDCIIANQNGINEKYTFVYRGFNIVVICTDTCGVSINRNVLLDNLTADFGLMLDDDCVMQDNYVETIKSFLEKYPKSEFILFNGNLVDGGSARKIHNKKTKHVSKYYHISYAGAPGLCFKKESVDKINARYDESLGVPNYIEAGEDTFFHYTILKKSNNFYRSSDTLFNIFDNASKSSYYIGVDKRYVETRGYVTYYIHPRLFCLYKIKHCLRFKRMNKTMNFWNLISCFNEGKRLFLEKERYSEK